MFLLFYYVGGFFLAFGLMEHGNRRTVTWVCIVFVLWIIVRIFTTSTFASFVMPVVALLVGELFGVLHHRETRGELMQFSRPIIGFAGIALVLLSVGLDATVPATG